MFCLGCGAEVPSRAARCRVCGRKLSSSTETSEATRESASPVVSTARLATLASASLQTSVHSPSGTPNVSAASATGLPRDPAGRLLLLTAAALAADLLAPWSIVYGQQKTMAANGASAWALLALFLLAALPLLRSDYRARPHVAVVPLIVGAFCLGAGIFYWALLARENALAASQDSSPMPSGFVQIHSSPALSQAPIAPGFGLYLFLIGSGVLAFVGYRLFLQAALATAHATVRATAAPAIQPVSPTTQPATQSDSASMPQATAISPATPSAAPTAASSPLAAILSASEPPPVSASTPAANHIALPGSAAWNEAPKVPTHIRPSRLGGSGWSRQAGVRR